MKDHQTILIGNPSAPFRARLAEELKKEPAFRLAGETGDGGQLLRLTSAASPVAVILDPDLHGLRGADLLTQILARKPRPLVLLSDEAPDGSMRGFLTSDAPVFYRRAADPSSLSRELTLLLEVKGDHEDPSIPLKGEIEGILVEFGLPNNTDSFRCLRDAIYLLRKGTWPATFVMPLYECLAKQYGVARNAMAKNIRSAVRQAYENGKPSLLQTYLGPDFFHTGKNPSAKHFLRAIADRVCVPDSAISVAGKSADRYFTVTAGLEEKTDAVLRKLALPETVRGTRVLRDALLLFLTDRYQPSLLQACRRVAEQSGTTAESVDSALSQVVDYLDTDRSNPALEGYFGPVLTTGSRNLSRKTVFTILADQIRRSESSGQPEPAKAAAIRDAAEEAPADPAASATPATSASPSAPPASPAIFGPIPRAGLVIRDLGLSEETQEGHILREILFQCLQKEEGPLPPLRPIYARIAEEEGLGSHAIPMMIQTAVSQILTTCKEQTRNRYFGASCAGRTCSLRGNEFFGMLVSRVRIEDKGDPLYVQTADTLNRFGFRSSLMGYFYLADGVILYLERASSMGESWFTQALAVIAERHSVEPHSVSISTQTAVRRAWELWDDRFLETEFGSECVARKAPPSVPLVITTIAGRIRPQTDSALTKAEASPENSLFRRVVIGNRSRVICASYATLFQRKVYYSVIASTDSGLQLLRLIQTARPDIVILDPALNDLEGAALLSRMADLEEKPLVLLTSPDPVAPASDLSRTNVFCVASAEPADVVSELTRILDRRKSGADEASPWKERIGEILTALQFHPGTTDYCYMELAITLCLQNREADFTLTTALYDRMAEELGVSIWLVYHVLRQAVAQVHTRCDRRTLEKYAIPAFLDGIGRNQILPFIRGIAERLSFDELDRTPEGRIRKALLDLYVDSTTRGYQYLLAMILICLQQDPDEPFRPQILTGAAASVSTSRVALFNGVRKSIAAAFPRWNDRTKAAYFGAWSLSQTTPPSPNRFAATIAERIRIQDSPWDLEARTRQALLDLGVDPSYTGYCFLREAIVPILQSNADETFLLRPLLIATAKRHFLRPASVENSLKLAIRQAVALWDTRTTETQDGDRTDAQEEKTFPARFIAEVVRKIRLEIRQEARVSAVLQDLGLSAEHPSRRCLLNAVILRLRGDAVEESELYETIAERHGGKAEAVRGALTEAVEDIATRCTNEAAVRYFGPDFAKLFYPAEGEVPVPPFIAGIADWIRQNPAI